MKNETITGVGTLLTVGGATMGQISPEEINEIGAMLIGLATIILQIVNIFKKKK